MNKTTGNPINVIATGILVTILFSLALFWCRLFCFARINEFISESSSQVIISPSGLVPGEPAPKQLEQLHSKPPGPEFSQVYAEIKKEFVLLNAIGAFCDIFTKMKRYGDVNERVYYWYYNENRYLCYDKHTGLIIRRFKSTKDGWPENSEIFVGPDGMSGTVEASSGRFYDPIITTVVWEQGPSKMCLYDKKIRRFYVIDFDKSIVRKGLQLKEGDSIEPTMMKDIVKGISIKAPLISWNSPMIWNDVNSEWKWQGVTLNDNAQSSEIYHFRNFDWSCTFIPVLDKTGRIHIYNTREESLMPAGYLPFPESHFTYEPHSAFVRPGDVLNYDVCPVYAVRRLAGDSNKPPEIPDVKFLGTIAACIAREGTSMTVAIFDPNGNLVFRGDTRMKGRSTSKAVYSEAQLLSIILFLLENLQPPVFEVASFFSGNFIEAGAGHRALFILPNSFLGMLGRYRGTHFDREVFGPQLMLPSLILSVWLALRVRKDATLTGLSRTAKKWWMIGTITFGLPVYITYRLTKQKEPLITCQNCGKMRRPDMETCHRCGSKWEIPELTAPNWRIYE